MNDGGREQSCSGAGLRLEKMLTDCHSGTRLAFYGAPAAVGVLLFANGIPRVQRDILQVRPQRNGSGTLTTALTPLPQKIPVLGDYFRKEIHPADNVSRTPNRWGASFSRANACTTALLNQTVECGR